jgi:hypothetical protein
LTLRGGIAAAAAACAVAAGVAGTAWAVQLGFLVRPAPEDVVAARSLAWLGTDSLVESTFAFGGGRVQQSLCIGTWQRLPHGHSELAAVLALDGTRRVIPVGQPFVTKGGSRGVRPSGRLLAQLRLAGCPSVLASLLGGAIRRPAAPDIRHVRIGGQSALALRAWTKGGNVTVYVADDGLPLAVTVEGPGLSGRSTLHVTRLSAPERRALEAGL